MKSILLFSIALLPAVALRAQAPRAIAPNGMRVTPISTSYLSVDDDPVRNQFRHGLIPYAEPESATVRPPTILDPNRAYLTLIVPDNADVILDGVSTATSGSRRRFVSPPLDIGRSYRYDVRVRWSSEGAYVERRLEVPVHAGDTPVVIVMAPLAK
jgi:uncharacterized protein (TIGR03000 family)